MRNPFRRRPRPAPAPPAPAGPVVEKRRVTMSGNRGHGCVDFVPLEILDDYVADAKTRWQHVEVGDSHDPGPAGDHGPTHYPPHLQRSQDVPGASS